MVKSNRASALNSHCVSRAPAANVASAKLAIPSNLDSKKSVSLLNEACLKVAKPNAHHVNMAFPLNSDALKLALTKRAFMNEAVELNIAGQKLAVSRNTV